MLPCDWRSVQETLLPADYYRPPPKKKKKETKDDDMDRIKST